MSKKDGVKQQTTNNRPLVPYVFGSATQRDSTVPSSKWLDQCPQRPPPWNQPSSSDKTRPNGYDIDFERSWSSQRVGSQRFQGHLLRVWTNQLFGVICLVFFVNLTVTCRCKVWLFLLLLKICWIQLMKPKDMKNSEGFDGKVKISMDSWMYLGLSPLPGFQ